MSKPKPLSYASLKTVIEHMDPNLRVLLFVKLPSIRHAEKATPMKLDELKIPEFGISLKNDSYFYEMNVMRYIKEAHALKRFNVFGITYSTIYDVDEYGIQVMPLISTPGDLDFGNSAIMQRTEEELRHILELFPVYHYRLATMDLKDLEMKRDNVKSPYTHFIHLSNVYQGAESVIEKVEYNQNLSIAIKYLIQNFLGGRQKASHWSSLESITVDTLDNRDREILNSIATVCVFGHPHWSTELPYRRMKFLLSRYEYQDYLLIAKNLKVTQPSHGSHYTFKVNERTSEALMEMMETDEDFENRQLQASKVTKYPECFILQINNRSEVLIYFSFDPSKKYSSFRFTLEMEIQPRVENLHN